jgi:hypothetical protein
MIEAIVTPSGKTTQYWWPHSGMCIQHPTSDPTACWMHWNASDQVRYEVPLRHVVDLNAVLELIVAHDGELSDEFTDALVEIGVDFGTPTPTGPHKFPKSSTEARKAKGRALPK